jgi:hypothetical protein
MHERRLFYKWRGVQQNNKKEICEGGLKNGVSKILERKE